MEEKPASSWTLRLAALGFGILGVAVVYLIAFKISNDIRVISASGIIFLFCAAVWLGRNKSDWFSGIVLIAPMGTIFVYEVLYKVPALWPNLLLWAAAAAIGLVFLRMVRKRIASAIAVVAALLLAAFWFCGWYTPKQLASAYSKVKDTSAPRFNLQPVSRDFESARSGKILVLDFFSTTCAPCIAELPQLMAARGDLKDQHDVEFVLVASDRGNDTPEKFRAFAENRHVTMPLAFDPEGKAHESFGLTGVPALVILDRAGRVRFTHEGYNPAEATFRQDLVQFIKTLN